MFKKFLEKLARTQDEKTLDDIKKLYIKMTKEFHIEKKELLDIYKEIEKFLSVKDKIPKEKLASFNQHLKEKEKRYKEQLESIIDLESKFNEHLKEFKDFYDLNNLNNYIGNKDSSFMEEFKLEEKYHNLFKPKEENVKSISQPKKKLNNNNNDFGLGI